MLNRKMKTAALSLVSVLAFGCSATNGVTVPTTEQIGITQADSINFNAKAAPLGQQGKAPAIAQGDQVKPSGSPAPKMSPSPKPPAPPSKEDSIAKPSCSPDADGNMAPPPPPKMNDGKPPVGGPKPSGSPRPVPSNGPIASPSPDTTSNLPKFTVTISGGFETNPVDHGRPVVLIASALGVPTEVFRSAFSLVTPAAGGVEPDPAQVNLNKAALLSVLGTYGITNDFLDTVSNYYRYNESAGEVWKRTQATAKAIVTNDQITGIEIINPGAGYSSTPTVTISGVTGVTATASVSFTEDFSTNGSISTITLNK